MRNGKNIRLLVAALIFSSSAEAHHDLGSKYAMKETIHIEGKVLQFPIATRILMCRYAKKATTKGFGYWNGRVHGS